MATYYVVCINKHPYHQDPYARIQYIGTNMSRDATSYTQKWTVDQVVWALRQGDVFYSSDKYGDLAELEVASHNGQDYVKTRNDGIYPDNLLAKNECS